MLKFQLWILQNSLARTVTVVVTTRSEAENPHASSVKNKDRTACFNYCTSRPGHLEVAANTDLFPCHGQYFVREEIDIFGLVGVVWFLYIYCSKFKESQYSLQLEKNPGNETTRLIA